MKRTTSFLVLSSRWVTWANLFSLYRLLVAPLVAWAIVYEKLLLATLLFITACISDALDGYCARRLNERTAVGHYLDPLADKALVLLTLGALVWHAVPSLIIPQWFLWVMAVRELVILVGGLIVLRVGRIAVEDVASTTLGKLTTLCVMILITWVFACVFTGWRPHKSFAIALVCITTLVFASLVEYGARAFAIMRRCAHDSVRGKKRSKNKEK